MRRTIVFAGSLAQKPAQGGFAWVLLQYLLGFKRLDWDVLFLDRLETDMAGDSGYVRRVMDGFGLADSFAVACDGGTRFVGLSRNEIVRRVSGAELFINVMGFFTDAEILAAAPRRVFFDIDPGFGQMWCDLGLHDPYDGYDAYVTVGENIGRADCHVPECGRRWIATRHPVVLERWPAAAPAAAGSFTSIGAWRGPYAPIEYKGRTYGLRAHEFRKLAELPLRTHESFEVALDIHPADKKDLDMLSQNGWRVADPAIVARDPDGYQAYIGASKGAFVVAKSIYVQSRNGLVSDQSICYLASGRPVLALDTGLDSLYELGQGMVTFTSLEEAAAGVEEIAANYTRHCRAAREMAEEYFDSDKVLSRLLGALGA
jgi:hypothetical protein